jgi:DNA polymerase-3 subunit alpha
LVPPTEKDQPAQLIRFGMAAIKNVGTGAVEEILRAREDGEFVSLEDFLTRVSARVVNRKALESLVKAGALDRFGERSTLWHNLDVLSAFAARVQKQAAAGQTDLFGNGAEPHAAQAKLELAAPTTPLEQRDQLIWERELLGLYLSQHPLEAFATYLAEQTVPLSSLKPEHDGRAVTVGGAITDVRDIVTKNGQHMAFVKLEDQSGEIEVVLFPSAYQQTVGLWERDRVVLIRGKVNARGRDGAEAVEAKVMGDDAREITPAQAAAYEATGKQPKVPKPKATTVKHAPEARAEPANPRVYIRLTNTSDQDKLVSLKQTIDSHHGDTEVVLVLGEAADKQAIKLPGGIDVGSDGMDQLKTLVGADNLVVR